MVAFIIFSFFSFFQCFSRYLPLDGLSFFEWMNKEKLKVSQSVSLFTVAKMWPYWESWPSLPAAADRFISSHNHLLLENNSQPAVSPSTHQRATIIAPASSLLRPQSAGWEPQWLLGHNQDSLCLTGDVSATTSEHWHVTMEMMFHQFRRRSINTTSHKVL